MPCEADAGLADQICLIAEAFSFHEALLIRAESILAFGRRTDRNCIIPAVFQYKCMAKYARSEPICTDHGGLVQSYVPVVWYLTNYVR